VRVAAPSPSAQRNVLAGVSCATPTTCTAVGHFETAAGVFSLVVTTSDGTTWTRRAIPAPSNLAELRDVSCVSATECTAVGTYFPDDASAGLSTFVVRTANGVNWTRATSPTPGGMWSVLSSVACVTATRCRAVGQTGNRTLVLRTSNGQQWFREASPNLGNGPNELRAIDCSSNAQCTAVGHYYATGADRALARTLVVRLTFGPPWVAVPSPNPAPATSNSPLNDVSCSAPSSCVAVGTIEPAAGGVKRAFILRTTDGTTWTRASTPVVGRDIELAGVDCQSATTCTAVGFEYNPANNNRILHASLLRTTDGTTWSSPSPVSERSGRAVLAVSCATDITCVGVGTFNDTGFLDDPLRSLVLKET
jgi:hypothetical protein